MFDAIFGGLPANVPSPAGANAVASGIDTNTNALYASNGGWKPVSASVAKSTSLAQTSTLANLLTYVAPVTGLYSVRTYTMQATSTSGTLPVPTVTFTEGDTGTTGCTVTTVASGTATTGEGQSQSGDVAVFALAGSSIVVSVAAPTTLTYNAKARIAYIG